MRNECVCPMCEGRGKTMRMIFGECPEKVRIGHLLFETVGVLQERPCGKCKGKGVLVFEDAR